MGVGGLGVGVGRGGGLSHTVVSILFVGVNICG